MEGKKKKNIVSNERKSLDLQAFSRTVLPLTKKLLGANRMIEVDLLSEWENIVGEEMAAYSLPTGVKFPPEQKINGVLLVEVPSGAFALELKHKENFVIAKVNSYFGYCAIAKLKIVQTGEFEIKEKDNIQDRQKTLVTEKEENYIKELSKDIKNKELQYMLEKLGRMVVSDNKDKK